MEKFPQGEMGWVSKSEVQDYIARNYVPNDQYSKKVRESIDLANGFNAFLDYLVNLEGPDLTIRTAIMAGCSKEFVLKWVYDDEDRYTQCYAELVAEGEILVEEEDE